MDMFITILSSINGPLLLGFAILIAGFSLMFTFASYVDKKAAIAKEKKHIFKFNDMMKSRK